MKIGLNRLLFKLPDKIFSDNLATISSLSSDLKIMARKAGVNNDQFKHSWGKLYKAIEQRSRLDDLLDNRVDIRALGFMLTSKHKEYIKITNNTLTQINRAAPKPSTLFLENFFQYYLNDFDQIDDLNLISSWLRESRKLRNLNCWYDQHLISSDGPKWLANFAISKDKDFDQVLAQFELDRFQSGQFMEAAKKTYYVEQLRNIPANKKHDLLSEVQKPEVFESRYTSSELLGHQILQILIEKAPYYDVHESWVSTVMSIAGDPRVAVGHPRFIKWWSHIDKKLIDKVKTWLSALDLKLFLDALENFSCSSIDPDMKRMYPSRKRFLEGLHEKKLIKNTKLYMSRQMATYLEGVYDKEHLPEYSLVEDGDKSIIYVDLGSAHLVEGSHQCQLWIYRALHDSAPMFKFGKQIESYRNLTKGLHESMEAFGNGAFDHFTHAPKNFSWQKRSIDNLKRLGVSINMKDVLTSEDYRAYVRIHGVS